MTITSDTVNAANAETSRQEVEAFKHNEHGSESYFAYHNAEITSSVQSTTLRFRDHITTWTGDILATVNGVGKPWTSNFGDVRQRFWARGIDGNNYSGTAYLSSGDYVRMRKVK